MTMVLTMRSAKANETRNQLVTFWSGRSSQTARHTRTLPTMPATTKTITQMKDQLYTPLSDPSPSSSPLLLLLLTVWFFHSATFRSIALVVRSILYTARVFFFLSSRTDARPRRQPHRHLALLNRSSCHSEHDVVRSIWLFSLFVCVCKGDRWRALLSRCRLDDGLTGLSGHTAVL